MKTDPKKIDARTKAELIRKKRESLRRSGQSTTADTATDTYIWQMWMMSNNAHSVADGGHQHSPDLGSAAVDPSDASPGISHESGHASDSASHSCGSSSHSCSSGSSCGGGGGGD